MDDIDKLDATLERLESEQARRPPVVNPVQTALGCSLRTVALAYPINGAER